jgi:hypothetical protein
MRPGTNQMPDVPAEPNWSLLPHDPVGFFGLSAGFDRRELKRSYNQLIRRFKPERFPQEFQQIRAAFEQLDSDIRYGQTSSSPEPASDRQIREWIKHAATPLSSGESPPTSLPRAMGVAPSVPLHERLQTGSVSEAYRELKNRPQKSPYDYYSLAVISDVVDRQEGRQFARWILQGLADHRNEIGLMRLLHAYFCGAVESEECESLLVTCSKIVREDLFFPLTEPLWRLLLRGPNFGHFSAALRQCEANLNGINIDNRLAFYLQILKPALWVADLAWIKEAFNFIEQNYDRIPRFMDYDVEILSRLRAYIEIREQFRQGDAFRQRLDAAMRDYFGEDQITGDQSVLACQVLMARDTEGLGAAFSDFGNPTYAPFFAVWNWISYDVGERHVEPPKEKLDETVWHPRTKLLLAQIEQQTRTSRLGTKWFILRLVYYPALALVFLISVIGTCCLGLAVVKVDTDWQGYTRGADTAMLVLGLSGAALGGYLGYRFPKLIERRFWQPFTRRISKACYRQLWQREIINFLARSHLSYQTLRAYVHSIPTRGWSSWVKQYIDQDFALPMFAMAHHFVV